MARSTPREAIRFGTSGWRGVLGDGFHFAGVRAVARALAERLDAEGQAGAVVVAHDTRFLGAELASACARVLAASGRRVVRAAAPMPTPVASHAVRARRAAAGLVLTASHNPPQYQGLKVVAPWGGAAPVAWTRDLERRAARILRGPGPAEIEPAGRAVDFVGPYRRALMRRLNRDAIAEAAPAVAYDALHGVGAGILDELLQDLGAKVVTLRGEHDPRFGGAAPDPVPERLDALRTRVRGLRGLRFGLATDGDADRFAAVDASGALISETDAVALLVDHLAERGRIRRGIAISVATGSLVEKVARFHGLAVERVPIGFKHLTEALEAGRADVAGEESGGFTWGAVSRDKDGLLAACLLLEHVAETRRSLGSALRRLHRTHGASACGRLALSQTAPDPERLLALRKRLPAQVDGARVTGFDASDGLRIELEDGFLMLRASGTEPVVRVYAEVREPERLGRRLRAGVRLLGGRPRSS